MVDALLNRSTTPLDPNTESATYADARGSSRDAIMLDVRFADGRIVSFNYAYFVRMEYRPGDSIELRFGDASVLIEGRRLGQLRQSLSEHRRREIKEDTEAEDGLKSEEDSHIERIEIQEKKED
jgi:hypothetical protein